MSEPAAAPSVEHRGQPDRPGTDSVTRAFLFADLRGYTDFVERRGAAAAAELLSRYRTLVRQEIERFDGAEIRTEGDSFYVVFGSVTAAVRCGLAIVEAARSTAAEGAAVEAIPVGIGVHAGETVETPEGYVGQPVNIAARLCALAAAGEVLVSDTVRALSQSVLGARFSPRGRRRLKGVAEPVAVFAVERLEAGTVAWPAPRRRARSRERRWQVAALVGAVALAGAGLGAIAWAGRTGGVPSRDWTIGVSLPFTGDFAPFTEPLRRSIELAVEEANRDGGIGGASLTVAFRDTGTVAEPEDPSLGAAHASAFIAESGVVAMIGPFTSGVAESQIPLTNRAGLLQCSPSTTDPGLTKPRAGALDLRSADPERISFVRLTAAADIEAAAGASFAFNDLGARTALVIDDTNDIGVADDFEREFEALRGALTTRTLNPGADPSSVLEPLASSSDPPRVVFFGGFTEDAAEVRRTMVELGYGDTPFLGWDAMWDGSGAQRGSFIERAGDAAAGSWVSRPSVGTIRADFERRYRAKYGSASFPGGSEYAGAAYACAEIIIAALRHAATVAPGAEQLREAVRSFVADPANRFETILGPRSFDANGDSIQQFVTFYRVDPLAAEGAGDWVVVKQQDFGPAR